MVALSGDKMSDKLHNRMNKYLEKGGSKFLFNLYLPKENGETTECDVEKVLPIFYTLIFIKL